MNKETRITIVKGLVLDHIRLLSIHDLTIEDGVQILKDIIELLEKK